MTYTPGGNPAAGLVGAGDGDAASVGVWGSAVWDDGDWDDAARDGVGVSCGFAVEVRVAVEVGSAVIVGFVVGAAAARVNGTGGRVGKGVGAGGGALHAPANSATRIAPAMTILFILSLLDGRYYSVELKWWKVSWGKRL